MSAATGSPFLLITSIVLGLSFLCCCAISADSRASAIYKRAEHLRRTGDASGALKQIELGFAQWANKPNELWHWRFRLLRAEIDLARNEMEKVTPVLAQSPPPVLRDNSEIQARLLVLRASVENRPDLREQACFVARKGAPPNVLSRILVICGMDRTDDRQYDLAEKDLASALAAAGQAGDSFLRALAEANLARLRLLQHHFDESLGLSLGALEAFRREGAATQIVPTLDNLGWCYFRLGDYDKAEEYFTDSATEAGKAGKVKNQQDALGNLGSVHYAREDYQGAIRYYQQALSIAEGLNSGPSAQWLINLATTYTQIGDLEKAESNNNRALTLYTRNGNPSVRVSCLINAARIASRRGKTREAIDGYREALQPEPQDPMQQWQIHAGLADAYSTSQDPRAEAEFSMASNILDESWTSLINDKSKLTFPILAHTFHQRYVAYLMKKGRHDAALDFVEAHRAQLLAQKTRVQNSATLADLSKARNEVLLSYWLAPEQSYLWAVAPGKPPRQFPLPPEERICKAVDEYSKAILDKQDVSQQARALYQMLLAPVKEILPGEVKFAVVLDGCLHGVNLETLMTPGGRFWLEDATVEVAPSLRLLESRNQLALSGDSILVIGNPTQSGLPDLLFAPQEIDTIAQVYPKHVLKTGDQARPGAYRQANPANFGLIHFTAHALANSSSPLDSSIALSRGQLYAHEIQDIRLNNTLVTISACQSAGAKTYTGEGLVGFAWAFLGAQASGVIGSLWDVNDHSTAEFMGSFYRHLSQNGNPVASLHETKLDFLKKPSRRQPYYWAPFQIYVR